MKNLRSYIAMVEPQLLNHINGSVKEFIHLFQEKIYVSEEAFIQKVCGENSNKRHYHYLKSRAIKILQALAIISHSNGVSTVQKKYDLCQKKFVIAQKIIAKGDRKEGIEQMKQAYRIAVAYDFVYPACELASLLYHHYIYFQPHPTKAAKFAKAVEKYLHDYTAEKKAEHHFYQVIKKMNRSLRAVDYAQSLEKINEFQGNSRKYKVYQAIIGVFDGFSNNDYLRIIKSCDDTLRVLKSKKGVYDSHYLFFLMNKAKAQMALRQYYQAEKNYNCAENYVVYKSINHGLIQLHKALNYLHAGNYEQAHELYKLNRKCKFENIKEQFAIIEAYLCFLSKLGYLQLKYSFRLGKYLNETFKAQEDKAGSNINIIIAELLVYLVRDRGKFIDRVEAVQNYSYRHLKTKDTRRAKQFIKILCLLPKVNFHPVALQRKAQRYIEYLRGNPISVGENVSIEILPFETVLAMILRQLARKVA